MSWLPRAGSADVGVMVGSGAGPLVHSMLPTELLIGLIYVVMDLLLVLQQLM